MSAYIYDDLIIYFRNFGDLIKPSLSVNRGK